MRLTSLLSLAFAAQSAAAATAVFARDVTLVQTALSTAHTDLHTLAHDLHVYLQGGQPVAQQPTLDSDSSTAFSALDKATAAIKSTGAFSSTDASTVLQTATNIEATMNDICESLAMITAVGSPPNQVQMDIDSLNIEFDKLLIAFRQTVPGSILSQVTTLKSKFEADCPVIKSPTDPSFL